MEHAGFCAYSDREIPEDFRVVLEDARFRVEGMELYRGAEDLRIFVCRSQRLFVFLNRLAGKGHDDSWRSTMGYVDRRHFRWHVLVEYLWSVKGLTFTDLMDAGVTEKGAESQMMSWYSSLDTSN